MNDQNYQKNIYIKEIYIERGHKYWGDIYIKYKKYRRDIGIDKTYERRNIYW